ncbi:MAG: Hsp20/alpha crystallin family protein [Deltaproteobacteria bacterium]|nr:Hsp20/alpha crystallin family protein [Deltaproteobacteria bacterium]
MQRIFIYPSLRHEVDRLFDSMIHSPWGSRVGECCWVPPSDVTETPAGYRVEMDLPGVAEAALSIVVERRTLRVEGARERAKAGPGERHHLLERSAGRFVRNFQLPDDAEAEGIRARFEEGVLTIEVPRKSGGRAP